MTSDIERDRRRITHGRQAQEEFIRLMTPFWKAKIDTMACMMPIIQVYSDGHVVRTWTPAQMLILDKFDAQIAEMQRIIVNHIGRELFDD